MSIFIFDELTGLPTLLATNRAKRPDQTGVVNASPAPASQVDPSKVATIAPTTVPAPTPAPALDKNLVFAKGNEHLTPPTLYQDADDWNVRVFKNKFSIVDDHEVIVHSPFPDKDMEDLPLEQNTRIVRAYLNRVSYYGSQDKEILIFNNKGGKAGASITHPHSQIIALKGFPGILEKEKASAIKFYNEHNKCYWCDLIEKLRTDGKQVVYESQHFMLAVPDACRWSYELILLPKAHKPNFGFMDEMEIGDFARILKAALVGYNTLLGKPDRNFWIHTMRYEPYHWHVGFLPHVQTLGGIELGAGIWVSAKASPEDAARDLGVLVKQAFEAQ